MAPDSAVKVHYKLALAVPPVILPDMHLIFNDFLSSHDITHKPRRLLRHVSSTLY